jgi:hypothetical protein
MSRDAYLITHSILELNRNYQKGKHKMNKKQKRKKKTKES